MKNEHLKSDLSARTSDQLACFIAQTRWDDIPAPVRHEAKRSLINFFACALGGCRDAFIESASRTFAQYAGPAIATVIGRQDKADVPSAAFLNAASANVYDFDDTHARTVIHPAAPVAAALFAVAEETPIAGRELLLAFVLGVETECRIGNAISPAHYRRGWHITSTCGVFGAAAAIASVFALPAERVLWTLGNASAQSSGLLETLGTMAKSISVGNAARNGLMAALLAQQGVSGPQRPLEGAYGFLNVMGDNANAECITAALGAEWEAALNTYKPYPCGIVLNPVLDACLELSCEGRLLASDVERVEIHGHPLLRERTDRPRPQSGREAQVSAQHALAVALTCGRAGLNEFSDALAADRTLDALRDRIVFVDDDACSVEAAQVIVSMRDGSRHARTIDRARGSTGRPLSDRELEAKLEMMVDHGGSRCDPAPLIAAIWGIEDAADAGSIVRLAAGR